jgi:hypothetical protein
MPNGDDDLVLNDRHRIHLEAQRHKVGRTKLLIHGADSPKISPKRIPNFIKSESEPNLHA